jgi:Rrf2 family transcriptional regulator, iron-sulfur cluster assembly transcription factor
MKLTRQSEYGLKGLIYLAKKSDKKAVLTSEVSAAQNIPPSFLNKIFQKLVRAGILKSYRGYRGGFALARAPREITLRRIIETLEGPVDLWSPSANDSVPEGSGSALALFSVWQKTQLRINRMLDRITIKDILKKSHKIDKLNERQKENN